MTLIGTLENGQMCQCSPDRASQCRKEIIRSHRILTGFELMHSSIDNHPLEASLGGTYTMTAQTTSSREDCCVGPTDPSYGRPDLHQAEHRCGPSSPRGCDGPYRLFLLVYAHTDPMKRAQQMSSVFDSTPSRTRAELRRIAMCMPICAILMTHSIEVDPMVFFTSRTCVVL